MSDAFEKAKEQLGDLADLLHTWHAPMTDEEKLIASNTAVRLVDEALDALESQNQALQERLTGAIGLIGQAQNWAHELSGEVMGYNGGYQTEAAKLLHRRLNELAELLSPTQETDPE